MNAQPSLMILIIDDDAPVLQGIRQDLSYLEPEFLIETADDAEEASEIVKELCDNTELAMVLCDHVMPKETGVKFLKRLGSILPENSTRPAKVLFTGQAGHEDTIQAINTAQIDHYLAKPWDIEDVKKITKKLLTDFVIRRKLSPFPYAKHLDPEMMEQYIRDNPPSDSE